MFACLGFVVSSVCLSRDCDGTEKMILDYTCLKCLGIKQIIGFLFIALDHVFQQKLALELQTSRSIYTVKKSNHKFKSIFFFLGGGDISISFEYFQKISFKIHITNQKTLLTVFRIILSLPNQKEDQFWIAHSCYQSDVIIYSRFIGHFRRERGDGGEREGGGEGVHHYK